VCFVDLEHRMQILYDVTLCRWVRIHLGVKVKVQFTLEQAMKVKQGSRGIAVLFL
jgi:hypothetical protein